MRYFDYEKAAREAKIPAEKLAELRRIVREEFPRDEMMYELHLLRVCMAIQQGLLTIEEAVKPEAASRV
jgi:phosphopantetheinyl transferase